MELSNTGTLLLQHVVKKKLIKCLMLKKRKVWGVVWSEQRWQGSRYRCRPSRLSPRGSHISPNTMHSHACYCECHCAGVILPLQRASRCSSLTLSSVHSPSAPQHSLDKRNPSLLGRSASSSHRPAQSDAAFDLTVVLEIPREGMDHCRA